LQLVLLSAWNVSSETLERKRGASAGSEGVSPQTFVVFSVGSGTYQFVWNAQ
jgi:hypothetical protein